MGRKRTGVLEGSKEDGWFLRMTVSKGKRERFPLGKGIDKRRARAKADAYVARLNERGAESNSKLPSVGATVREFGEAWTSGQLLKEHGPINGLKTKKSVRSDVSRLKLVYRVIGDLPVADVTDRDIDRVMAAHEPGRRGTTLLQTYLVLHRLFNLAIVPGRFIKENPVKGYHRPPKDSQKLFVYLFPRELIAVLKSPTVPTDRKVLYCLGCYTGLRKGSLFALTRHAVDPTDDVIVSLDSKTGMPLYFEIGYGLPTVIRRWVALTSGKPSDPLVPKVRKRHRDAELLREDLKTAGITRDVLFSDAPNVEPLRFHDLRATFVTWAKRAGKGDGWITDRTGHLTPGMVERYSRSARTSAELKFEPFPDLTNAIPELCEGASQPIVVSTPRRRNGVARPARSSRIVANVVAGASEKRPAKRAAKKGKS